MRAFMKFAKGMMKMALGWRLWLVLLAGTNMLVPLVFLNHFEARVVLITMLLSMALMTVLTAATGFSRLLGLGHVLWIPLVAFLATRLDVIPADDAFGMWLRAVIVLNAVSLVIDTLDVVRYVAGDRAETIKGL